MVLAGVGANAQNAPAPELPRPTIDVPGITPEVLARTAVPGAPWKIAIATRVTYQPGARVRKHYHTSQVVFYILEGAMIVQDDGKEPVTLKPGDLCSSSRVPCMPIGTRARRRNWCLLNSFSSMRDSEA
jgi:hypothetical protein